MGGVQRIGTVYPSRADDPNGGLALFHGADLHRAGLSAQQSVFGDIEGVLGVPGRVVFGDVQRFKVVVVQLHFRAVHHVEAHAQKDLLDLVHD